MKEQMAKKFYIKIGSKYLLCDNSDTLLVTNKVYATAYASYQEAYRRAVRYYGDKRHNFKIVR